MPVRTGCDCKPWLLRVEAGGFGLIRWESGATSEKEQIGGVSHRTLRFEVSLRSQERVSSQQLDKWA